MRRKLIELRQRIEQAKRAFSVSDRRETARFRKLRGVFYESFWREAAENLGVELESLGYGFFRITRGGKWTLVHLAQVMLDDYLTLKMAGNKPLMHRLIAQTGCPTPRFAEFDLTTLERARTFLREIGGPAVVKPASGTGGGRGITTKVSDWKRLKRASLWASGYGRSLMIEEQIPGDSFRMLYLDGTLIDAVRRDRPTVIGDGVRSILGLAARETAGRLSADPVRALSPLTVDPDCEITLEESGRTPRDIPPANQEVVVKSVANQNSRVHNHRVHDEVHTATEQLGKRLVTAFGVRLAGVDLMTRDISLPLEETGGLINEINTTPGLHHHVLVADDATKSAVGEQILERILETSERRILVPADLQKDFSHAQDQT